MKVSTALVSVLVALPVTAGSAAAQQTEAAKLVPPWRADCYTCYIAGARVAISGEWALVGAISEAVFMYRREPGGWVFRQAFAHP